MPGQNIKLMKQQQNESQAKGIFHYQIRLLKYQNILEINIHMKVVIMFLLLKMAVWSIEVMYQDVYQEC